ncbi:MAG: DNA mismatch repair protein MutS [Candidatus Hydrogenedentes bacterium]|nr:DNA mismatch repair protein MutS [Candidatus Hydrogenedentota bacterium]
MQHATPRTEYEARLAARRATASTLARRCDLFANLRLAVFAAAIITAWMSFWAQWISALWLFVAAAIFATLLLVHDRALRARKRAEDSASFYEQCLARLDGLWMGKGLSGEDLAPPEHLHAADLDLFGKGSLFELLCTARTRAGERTLANWLLMPAAPDGVKARQAAVEELRLRLDLREELALLGTDVRRGVLPEQVVEWANAPAFFQSRAALRTAHAIAVLSVASVAGWAFLGIGPIPFMVSVIAIWLLNRLTRPRVRAVLKALEEPGRELQVLAGVLARLEREPFSCDRLRRVQDLLVHDGLRASESIARLYSLLTWYEARGNQLFAPVAILLLWDVHFAYAFEAWRLKYGRLVQSWLQAVGDLEALGALGAFAYEHPDYPFPEVVAQEPWLEAEQIGHPLLPDATCVRNDVQLGGELRLLVVSGSNMSGKSTLLRTVGINTVLALAGAPVCAARMRVSPMMVGATLRIQDSIQKGDSRFYAEIRKIRKLVAFASLPSPLLFLLDEILHGTNSHDRKIGADAIVRGLLDAGAIGLVTTHDLALAKTADELGARAANVHFEDHLENGKLVFDYRMRPGVVQKSNALELMRAVGLKV